MQQAKPHYDYWRTEQGLTLRYGHWRCPASDPKGTVLVLQGRSEFMEKYEETAGELVGRSLDVLSFDWRGQGLSDRMLPESEKGFVHSYDDYLEDLDAILKTIVQPLARGPLMMLSHSMGGHIGLRYMHRFAHPFVAGIFSAPMIDIQTGGTPAFFIRWLSRRKVAGGDQGEVVMGSGRSSPFPGSFTGNRLTSDPGRFQRTRDVIERYPKLSAALVTYGWLSATYDSIAILKQPQVARSIKIPLLFFVAGRDRIVSQRAILRFTNRVEHARLTRIENAKHEILQETDSRRTCFWQSFDDFTGNICNRSSA